MKKRPREPKPIVPILASASGPSLIKHLASCNNTVRSQSLKLLQSWLVSQNELSESEMKKLWKGLFYCVWHSDKTPNQVALINRITSLFLTLKYPLSLHYWSVFILTLRREWPGIDRLRLDKFYLLVRRFIKALFELMKTNKWDIGVLREFVGVLEKDGFLAEDKLQGNGVNYHITSVFLDELKGVGFPVGREVVDAILEPFFAAIMKSKDRVLVGKVKSCVFQELLKMGSSLLETKRKGLDCNDKDGDVLLGMVALKMGLSGKLYEVGSSVECVQGNRKVVFGLHEEFLKLEKELESSGIEILIPEYGVGDDDEEVPQLIPIEFDENNIIAEVGASEEAEDLQKDENESDVTVFRKNKKARKGDEGDKKAKKRKKKSQKENSETSSVSKENGNLIAVSGVENGNLATSYATDSSDGDVLPLNESAISNLRKQFEMVAAEGGLDNDDDADMSDTPIVAVADTTAEKKRKIAKNLDRQESDDPESNGLADAEGDACGKSGEKSAKKVRFAMKNNLVWKPQSPLPPQSLRIPPSVTPRGSALKKGVPPGPIREMPPAKKKVKKKVKIVRVVKSVSPAVKRRKKIRSA